MQASPNESSGCGPAEAESPHLKKGYRRKRTAFTDPQLARMERLFQENKYPGIGQRETLAANLGVSESRVQVWFQNRRSKFRKMQNNIRPANTAVCDVKGENHNSSSKETSGLRFSWPCTKVCGGKNYRIVTHERSGSPPFPNTAQIPPFHSQIPAIVSDSVAAPTIRTSYYGAQHYVTAPGGPVIFYGSNGFPLVSSVFSVGEATYEEVRKPYTSSDTSQDEQKTSDAQEKDAHALKHSVDEILAAKGLVKVHET